MSTVQRQHGDTSPTIGDRYRDHAIACDPERLDCVEMRKADKGRRDALDLHFIRLQNRSLWRRITVAILGTNGVAVTGRRGKWTVVLVI